MKKQFLNEKMSKPEFVELLKDANELDLFESFLKSQRKLLESKGLTYMFAKMDVRKFQELMKATLAGHADWPRWKKALLEMSPGDRSLPARRGQAGRACGL